MKAELIERLAWGVLQRFERVVAGIGETLLGSVTTEGPEKRGL